MARKSGLSVVANRPETPEPAAEVTPAVSTPATPAPRATVAKAAPAQGASRYAGQYHVGASYDENDETVEAFRELAFKTRRKQKDLLLEAMRLLVDKHNPYKG